MEFGDEEYVGEIQPRMAAAAVRVLESALPSILSGNPRLTPQDESKASYFRKRTPEDGRIDFTKTAREVFNLIRGVSKPFPGAFSIETAKEQLYGALKSVKTPQTRLPEPSPEANNKK